MRLRETAAKDEDRRRFEAQAQETAGIIRQLQATVNTLREEVQHARRQREEQRMQAEEHMKLQLELRFSTEEQLRAEVDQQRAELRVRDGKLRQQATDMAYLRAKAAEAEKVGRASEDHAERLVREATEPLREALTSAQRQLEAAESRVRQETARANEAETRLQDTERACEELRIAAEAGASARAKLLELGGISLGDIATARAAQQQMDHMSHSVHKLGMSGMDHGLGASHGLGNTARGIGSLGASASSAAAGGTYRGLGSPRARGQQAAALDATTRDAMNDSASSRQERRSPSPPLLAPLPSTSNRHVYRAAGMGSASPHRGMVSAATGLDTASGRTSAQYAEGMDTHGSRSRSRSRSRTPTMHSQLKSAYGGTVPFLPPGPTSAASVAAGHHGQQLQCGGSGSGSGGSGGSSSLLASVQSSLQREKMTGKAAGSRGSSRRASASSSVGGAAAGPRAGVAGGAGAGAGAGRFNGTTEHRDAYRPWSRPGSALQGASGSSLPGSRRGSATSATSAVSSAASGLLYHPSTSGAPLPLPAGIASQSQRAGERGGRRAAVSTGVSESRGSVQSSPTMLDVDAAQPVPMPGAHSAGARHAVAPSAPHMVGTGHYAVAPSAPHMVGTGHYAGARRGIGAVAVQRAAQLDASMGSVQSSIPPPPVPPPSGMPEHAPSVLPAAPDSTTAALLAAAQAVQAALHAHQVDVSLVSIQGRQSVQHNMADSSADVEGLHLSGVSSVSQPHGQGLPGQGRQQGAQAQESEWDGQGRQQGAQAQESEWDGQGHGQGRQGVADGRQAAGGRERGWEAREEASIDKKVVLSRALHTLQQG